MSNPIARVAARPAAVPSVKDARTEKLEKAAGEFESLFVKQLLKEAKIGGDQKSGGYADMAVDALATGIQRGGGLGLAKRIEQAMTPVHPHAPAVSAGPDAAKALKPRLASPVSPHALVAPLAPHPSTSAAKR
jgi:Rod binding domain-containing protein